MEEACRQIRERKDIRAVLFDVDGTLYAQCPLRAVMAVELALAHGNPARRRRPTEISIVRAFRRLREQLRAPQGITSIEQEQYSAVAAHLNCTEREVRRTVDEWIYRRPLKYLRWVRRPGLLQFLAALKSRDIRRGVFSDYPPADKIEALGLSGHFDLLLSAVDPSVGAFKPDPRGFAVACRRWGLSAKEVIYVGDRHDVDAAGAAAAGMRYALLGPRSAKHSNGWVVRNFYELERVISTGC
jgi:HAD superfamily hydrolase (TIGR01509 family)